MTAGQRDWFSLATKLSFPKEAVMPKMQSTFEEPELLAILKEALIAKGYEIDRMRFEFDYLNGTDNTPHVNLVILSPHNIPLPAGIDPEIAPNPHPNPVIGKKRK